MPGSVNCSLGFVRMFGFRAGRSNPLRAIFMFGCCVQYLSFSLPEKELLELEVKLEILDFFFALQRFIN